MKAVVLMALQRKNGILLPAFAMAQAIYEMIFCACLCVVSQSWRVVVDLIQVNAFKI